MLSTKFTHLLTKNPGNSNMRCRPTIISRYFSIKWIDLLSRHGARNTNAMNMSSVKFRIFVRDLVISRVISGWARSFVVNSVIKRCRRDRAVRDVWHRFRQALLKPKHTILFTTVGAAYKNNEEKPGAPMSCSKNISDAEMQALIADLESMEELAKATLFCVGCAKRVVIDGKHPGVRYCSCENATPPVQSYDGWEPYMEAEDVIIWRKEYKPGGLYAYKVYGRYKHIKGEDFAAIQVDGAYRMVWDSAVASLSVVERTANGLPGQDVLHWEVLWPRLFANRDYVYLRRHKEFAVKESCMAHKEAIFEEESCGPITGAITPVPVAAESPCGRKRVHSEAKRKPQEAERKEQQTQPTNKQEDVRDDDRRKQLNDPENRVFVIVSRSCKHPQVPATGSAIRVSEYWSHMVVKTLNGPNKDGMEFVLTYYDEPAVGGLPTAVMSWAMGRAGPAFLDRMRKAAMEYETWKKKAHGEETPNFTPGPAKVSFDNTEPPLCEEDMETSKEGPEINEDKNNARSENNITDDAKDAGVLLVEDVKDIKDVASSQDANMLNKANLLGENTTTQSKNVEETVPTKQSSTVLKMKKSEVKFSKPITVNAEPEKEIPAESEQDDAGDEESERAAWWRYFYPSYYFA